MNSGKTQNNKKDPLLLETLLKVLPPSSKVKNYLKQSQINTPMRPISAGYTMTQEKIELDQQKSTGCDFRFSCFSRSAVNHQSGANTTQDFFKHFSFA